MENFKMRFLFTFHKQNASMSFDDSDILCETK